MVYNMLSFSMLGILLEKHLGSKFLFVLWFTSGALGTLYSTHFVSPLWNIGTGTSQAVLGVSSFALLLVSVKNNTSRILKFAVIFFHSAGNGFIPYIFQDTSRQQGNDKFVGNEFEQPKAGNEFIFLQEK
ncbi:rhomboid family intramembrane serine protease [Xenorhabdus szentirmaii]|uniref:rhomboid family intramembrane serine protease n=1 Tax=Xenorhabdus szentirmaii TaxID=290112 RepID=UPI002B40678B|nr:MULTISPECIES: rhomboid family intramembrane serine protease [unclassified Xenorhabdus]